MLGAGRSQLRLDRRCQLQMTQHRGQHLCHKGPELRILTGIDLPFKKLHRRLMVGQVLAMERS